MCSLPCCTPLRLGVHRRRVDFLCVANLPNTETLPRSPSAPLLHTGRSTSEATVLMDEFCRRLSVVHMADSQENEEEDEEAENEEDLSEADTVGHRSQQTDATADLQPGMVDIRGTNDVLTVMMNDGNDKAQVRGMGMGMGLALGRGMGMGMGQGHGDIFALLHLQLRRTTVLLRFREKLPRDDCKQPV